MTGAQRPEIVGELLMARARGGDAVGVAALFTPDAVVRLADGAEVVGRENIERLWCAILADPSDLGSIETAVCLVAGDVALTLTKLADGTLAAEVHRLQSDGTWLCAVDLNRVC